MLQASEGIRARTGLHLSQDLLRLLFWPFGLRGRSGGFFVGLEGYKDGREVIMRI
jgi:hypothetical protein